MDYVSKLVLLVLVAISMNATAGVNRSLDDGICLGYIHFGLTKVNVPIQSFSDAIRTKTEKLQPYWDSIRAELLKCQNGSVSQADIGVCINQLNESQASFYKGFSLGEDSARRNNFKEVILLKSDLMCSSS